MVKSNFSTTGPLGTMIARKPGGGLILASNPRLLPAITTPPPPFPAGLIAALDTPRPAADNLSWIHLQVKRNSVFKSGPLKLITVIGQFSHVMVLAESLSTVIRELKGVLYKKKDVFSKKTLWDSFGTTLKDFAL